MTDTAEPNIKMSSILMARLLDSTHSFAGKNWYYEFREIHNKFEESNCEKAANRLDQRFSPLTKQCLKVSGLTLQHSSFLFI